MKICRLSRPPIQTLFNQFPQTRDFLLKNMEGAGHEVREFPIKPVKIPNRYLSYGLGIPFALFRFRKLRPDFILADNIESGVVALLIKSIFKTPFVFNFLDDYSLIASYDPWKLRYWGVKFFEKIVPRFADLVIVVDSMKKGYCLDCRIPESRLRMVPNGADTRRFRPEPADQALRKRLGLKDGKMVLFVGKINRYYKLDILLRAVPAVLSKAPETQFLMVGDGDASGDLKELCKRLGIEHSVIFTGFRPPEEIPGIINLSDLCVFSLPDSSALVIFEYMACAKAVVLPNGGTQKMGIPREMIPEECAVQVDHSSEGFSQGILYLLNHEEAAKKIGEKARELAVRSFDWTLLAESYLKALVDVLAEKGQLRPKSE
jgi:glycosyltransferase involved in cell wall biosynthesis